jgi:hypothetical protein
MPLPKTYEEGTLQDELRLSEGEKRLWSSAQSTTDHAIILLGNRIQQLSDSNNKYALAMNWLTLGILVFAILQFVMLLVEK